MHLWASISSPHNCRLFIPLLSRWFRLSFITSNDHEFDRSDGLDLSTALGWSKQIVPIFPPLSVDQNRQSQSFHYSPLIKTARLDLSSALRQSKSPVSIFPLLSVNQNLPSRFYLRSSSFKTDSLDLSTEFLMSVNDHLDFSLDRCCSKSTVFIIRTAFFVLLVRVSN